jgi:hypothetical protein
VDEYPQHALEQSLPVIRGQRLSLRGEVFNFLNL